jgi:3-phosphoshikimate 1-carboxyvinyltransferase
VEEHADGLTITPKPLSGGAFRTYDDHRMAHAGAVIGLRVPGIQLDDVACTAKTLPAFPKLWAELTTSTAGGRP